MRVDTAKLLATGGVKLRAGAGSGLDTLRKGDIIRAEVVSKNNSGVLTLKMESGHTFNAKLGKEMNLSQGDTLVLEVLERDNAQVSLAYNSVERAEDDVSIAHRSIVRDFADKSLAPQAMKLSELGMPVTEKSAQMMRDLMALNPKLTLDEAAFLVSNKLTDDPNIMQAALKMLAGGEKTDALIAKLMSSMGDVGSSNPNDTATQNSPNTAPLTNLLATIIKNSSSLMDALNHLKQTPSSSGQGIITQGEGNLQTNVANVAENLSQTGTKVVATTLPEALQTQQSQVVQADAPKMSSSENLTNSSLIASLKTSDGIISPESEQPGVTAQLQTQPEQPGVAAQPQTFGVPNEQGQPANTAAQTPTPAQPTPLTAEPPTLANMVTELLSQVPEFSSTPHTALERFSEMLLRVAGDMFGGATEGETLEMQLEKLFTRIGVGDADAGTHLRQAREELFARLAMLEEAISNSAQQRGTDLLSQTHRLMDHVRTLNNIEQFVYMQMPVLVNDQQKSADLYIFKRKGRRQVDPDNVNILMAIDLEFMGRWEALLNIKGKEVTLNMEVRGEREKEHFNENTVMLHRLLDEDGFKLVGTNIKLLGEETTPLTALNAVERYQGKTQTGIDIKW
ncbi:MAG: hypothetical protein FWC13_04140 [Oscillospiraceae bacterium]|nr:hypothetical protein [Oscillospiraceae bacterium]